MLKKLTELNYLFLFFLLITIIFFSINFFLSIKNNFYYSFGDSAFFVDLIHKISKTNIFDSSIYRSHIYTLPYLMAEPKDYCTFNLHDKNYIPNMLIVGHLYFISYFLSFFVKLGFSALDVTSAFFTLNYFLIFFSIFYYLKNKINILICIFFTFLIFSWAPLSIGFIGQFYFDRLYILPMILIIFLYHDYFNKRENYFFVSIIFLSIYASLVHERSAFMVGFFLVTFSILFSNFKFHKDARVLSLLILGFILIGYYLFYTKNIQESFYSGNVILSQFVYNFKAIFKDPIYQKNSLKLFMISFPLLILSLGNLKLFLVSFISLIPNFLISVGGAEKYSLITHYHAFYIPFLIASATIGFFEFTKKKYYSKNILILGSVFIIFFNLFFDYSNNKKILSFTKNDSSRKLLYNSLTFIFHKEDYEIKNQKYLYKNLKIRELIPEKSNITVPELFMPYLSTYDIKVNYFPVGLGADEFVLAHFSDQKDLKSIVFPSFQNKSKKSKINECINKKIFDNYDIVYTQKYENNSMNILYKLK